MSYWKQSMRRLAKAPIFTATVLVTLGLGIGANTVIFSAIYSMLLRPLPYSQPDRLVALKLAGQDKRLLDPSLPTIFDWSSQTKSLDLVAGGLSRSFGLTASGSPVSVVQAGMVTSGLLPALGIVPALGRAFTHEEESRGASVAILTDHLWRTRFGADPAVLGRTLELNEQPRTIIGVLPPGAGLPTGNVEPDLLIPISHSDYGRSRGLGHLQAIGRLREGATREDAQAELDGITRRLAQSYPEYAGLGADVQSLEEALRGRNRRPLFLLVGAGLLLLLIACANVTCLQLAQLLARRRELAIRVSLGAGLPDLTRQFLVDGLTLSALGAAAGLLFAAALQGGLPRLLSYAGVTTREPVSFAFPALLFPLAAALAIGHLFTLTTVLIARRLDPGELTKETVQPKAAHSRLRGALVIGQIALCMTLLLSAGLLVRSFFKVMSVNPGFRVSGIFEFGIGIPEARYNTERKMVSFHRRVIENLTKIPGVEIAAFFGRAPLTGTVGTDFEFETAPVERLRRPRVMVNVVSPEYFSALSIPLVRGRGLSPYDGPEKSRVVLVNEAFARKYSPEQTPLGRRIRTSFENGELNPGGALSEIVGVVRDIRPSSLEREPEPQVYLCALQYGLEGGGYVIRVARDDAGLAAAVASAVASVDPHLEQVRLRPLSEFVRRNTGARREAALLLGLLSLAGLALAAVGVYGVIAFRAGQRMREMAVRSALGANRWQVAGLILADGICLAVAGAALGALASLWTGSLLRAHLYATSPTDPAVIAAVAALLLLTSLASSIAPAWRVSRAPIHQLLAG